MSPFVKRTLRHVHVSFMKGWSSYFKWRWDFCHVLCKKCEMVYSWKYNWNLNGATNFQYFFYRITYRKSKLLHDIFCCNSELENAILIMWTLVWSFLHQLQIDSSQGWSIRLIVTKDILKTAATAETVMDNLAQNQLKYCTLFKAVF